MLRRRFLQVSAALVAALVSGHLLGAMRDTSTALAATESALVPRPTPTRLPARPTPTPTRRPVRPTPTPTRRPVQPTPVPAWKPAGQGSVCESGHSTVVGSLKANTRYRVTAYTNERVTQPGYFRPAAANLHDWASHTLWQGSVGPKAYGWARMGEFVATLEGPLHMQAAWTGMGNTMCATVVLEEWR
jgi:hypothetical protein